MKGGRGDSIRMAFHYAGIPFEDEHLYAAVLACWTPEHPGKEIVTKMVIEERIPKMLRHLDKYLDQKQTTFSAGNKLTVADLRIYSALTFYESGILQVLPTDILDKYPHIVKLHQAIEGDEKISSWIKMGQEEVGAMASEWPSTTVAFSLRTNVCRTRSSQDQGNPPIWAGTHPDDRRQEGDSQEVAILRYVGRLAASTRMIQKKQSRLMSRHVVDGFDALPQGLIIQCELTSLSTLFLFRLVRSRPRIFCARESGKRGRSEDGDRRSDPQDASIYREISGQARDDIQRWEQLDRGRLEVYGILKLYQFGMLQGLSTSLLDPYPQIAKLYKAIESHEKIASWGRQHRMALHYGGIPFTDERLAPEWLTSDFKDSLPFGQVPILTIDENKVISQEGAIILYVGRLVGLYPDDREEAVKVDITSCFVEDLYRDFDCGRLENFRGTETPQIRDASRFAHRSVDRYPQIAKLCKAIESHAKIASWLKVKSQ
ncbi:hypothetical protein PSTT_12003 [Puccinia striiformis]|uniref:GST C-terminal domain-containing protein n=1 Tax=Puccinia striiformis TaxID=27350 RepID=A0A2S4UYD5_9BASI|nr:hypothetical protein PSTT_12003 [Puccinia striiformis]